MRRDINVRFDSPLQVEICPSNEVPAWAGALLQTMEQCLVKLGRMERKEGFIMTSVADVQAKATATLAAVTAESSVVNAVKAVVDHQNADIATLKQQLADAIAAGVDPAALKTLSDTLDAIQAAETSNAQVVADAVTAGTPPAPPAPPATPPATDTPPATAPADQAPAADATPPSASTT